MSRLISLVVGIYVGVIAAQNYEVPHAPSPLDLWQKAEDYSKGKKD